MLMKNVGIPTIFIQQTSSSYKNLRVYSCLCIGTLVKSVKYFNFKKCRQNKMNISINALD